MPGLQGERAGQEASQLPLGSLCGYPTVAAMPTSVPRYALGRAFALPHNSLIWVGSWG